ncbi:MAG: hypothetical protein M0R77_12775 [Gammaproteobacteria bacterium]|nr:hypothetical protein [Gammaproteobacteria bacterium]
MEPYSPALHIYNWMMNDAGLYSRFQDFVQYIKRRPTHIHSIANTANSLANDTAKKAMRCNDFSEEFFTADVLREAASLILRDAETESGVTIK